MSKYLANRQFPRLVPQNSMPVSIHDGEHGQTFGLVTNLSEGGASFGSGVAYPLGSRILLRISFDRDAEPFVTEATVAWGRTEEGKNKGFVHGAQFSLLEEEQVQLLQATLQRPEFQVVSRPPREFARLVPQRAIDATIADGQNAQAPGSVVNISEGGASFATNGSYPLGLKVLLRMAIDTETRFVSEASIVWAREAKGSGINPNFRFLYGAKFALLEEQQRIELQEILKRPEFKVVFQPDKESSGGDFPGMPQAELQTKSTTTE